MNKTIRNVTVLLGLLGVGAAAGLGLSGAFDSETSPTPDPASLQ